MRDRPQLQFIYFDAGGGHRAAATALKTVIEREGRPWDVRLVNLQELLDPLDIFRKLTGLRLQDIYNLLLRRGWTLGAPQLLWAMHVIIRVYHRAEVRLLERHWTESRPDLVVSLVPNFNRAIAQSVQEALPGVPFVTVLTDLADYPPHMWIERESEYLICGSDRAVEQARALGHPSERIRRVSGMIINPRFYEPIEVDRADERRRLGLDADRATGLVLFGGYGASVMRDIVTALDASGIDVQLILICGRNEKLRRAIAALKTRIPIFVEGFTSEVPRYMHLSDFFIGKPGPGSISEALAMKLPVIVERNAWTLPQERYNADWVVEHGTGIVVRSFRREVVGAVRRVLDITPKQLNNRAVFEIPEILKQILHRRDAENAENNNT